MFVDSKCGNLMNNNPERMNYEDFNNFLKSVKC